MECNDKNNNSVPTYIVRGYESETEYLKAEIEKYKQDIKDIRSGVEKALNDDESNYYSGELVSKEWVLELIENKRQRRVSKCR